MSLNDALLGGAAFLAGFMDSAVGGGGLVQVPALLLFLPTEETRDVANVLGTNKAASILGTATAVAQYATRVGIRWQSIAPAACVAFVCSLGGAMVVSSLDRQWLEPIVLVLLVLVTAYTALKPDLGHLHAPAFAAHHERALGLAVGAVLGFYDGFFGPGVGSFLIITFVGVFGFDFLRASASAKVINLATNLAALTLFASTGHVLMRYAVPMAVCNIAGSIVGTRVAVGGGNRLVRMLFLLVASALIARFGWSIFAGH